MKQFTGTWLTNMTGKSDMYKNACISLSQDLTSFKRNPVYNCFIGNDMRDEKTATAFYYYIKEKYPFLLEEKLFSKFQQNDFIGNPNLYSIEGKIISPGTLRFMKVLGDIFLAVNDISSIVEIGSGYGGQCFIFKQFDSNIEYTLLDISESLQISKKYLSENNCEAIYMDTNNIVGKPYALCISDYCLSEFDLEGTKFYINNVVKKCKAAYITTNSIGIPLFELVSLLQKVFPTVIVTPEEPKTSAHCNHIIICKND